jgi:predicted enzyme related to lactoylglutathione lyase
MTTEKTPEKSAMQLVVFPTEDPGRTKQVFTTLLGITPYIDGSYYVGFRTDGLEIGLDPNATGGPICYWNVDDIATSVKELVDSGATVAQEPHDVGGGMLVARVKDPNGNILGLRQASRPENQLPQPARENG